MKEPAPDLVVAGKYCLEGQLAAGGMGSVWVARHLGLEVPVAIKFMGPECASSDEGRVRFEREAKAAALLQSPHVVNVQDYGIDDGLAYIVMELLIGEDLDDRLHRQGRLTLEEMLPILVQASKALRRAQDVGIVHRDIKPHNLFLATGDDGEETLKILDFGIAKETGPTLLAKGASTGQIIGSPNYMSPEHVRGVKDIDFRADLWSLGVIVFQAVTGKLPFPGDIVGDVMGMILADPIPLATAVAPDLPPEIDAFFLKALARDRTKRFQSAREMAQAFAEVVRGPSSGSDMFPLSSRPPPAVMAHLEAAEARGPESDATPAVPSSSEEAASLAPTALPAVGLETAAASGSAAAAGARTKSTAPGPVPVTSAKAAARHGKASPARWGLFATAIAIVAVGGGLLLLRATSGGSGSGSGELGATSANVGAAAGAEASAALTAGDSSATVVVPASTMSGAAGAGASSAGAPTATTSAEVGPSKGAPQVSGKGARGGAPKTAASSKQKHPWGF